MGKDRRGSMRPLLVMMAVALVAVAVGARAPTPQATAAKLAKEKTWAPPRTPWGDPDLRGVFSNGDEYTTPLERPDQFAGRRLEEIKGAELANVGAETLGTAGDHRLG